MTWYEKAAVRGMIHSGANVSEIVKITGLKHEEVKIIFDELKKELEDGKGSGDVVVLGRLAFRNHIIK